MDRSQHYKKSSRISFQAFKDIFEFEDNERDKKRLKKDFKKIEKDHNGKVKFKHLIGNTTFSLTKKPKLLLDYYLNSSERFGQHMKSVEARNFLKALRSDDNEAGFNERLLKLICVN